MRSMKYHRISLCELIIEVIDINFKLFVKSKAENYDDC